MKVLLTTALGPDNHLLRVDEYIRALEWYKAHSIAVSIVECFSSRGPSIFEEYSDQVFYASVNDVRLKNKGVNEARALLQALDHFGYGSGDMLIKVTGRYQPNSSWFFDQVKEYRERGHAPGVVVLVRDGQIFTGVMGIEVGILRSFINSLDYEDMENNMVNIEYKLYTYIIASGIPFETVSHVNFSCNIAFKGTLTL